MSGIENNIGFVILKPNRPIQAGEFGTWVLNYICGKKKLVPGSVIKITLPRIWSNFQTNDPKGEGYTTITTTKNIEYDLYISYSKMAAAFQHLFIKIIDGYLSEGDIIQVIYGNKQFGSIGSQAQKIVEDYFVKDESWWGMPTTYFHTSVDYKGNSQFISLKDNHLWNPSIIPAKLWKIVFTGTSILSTKENTNFVLYGIDEFGNKVDLEPTEFIKSYYEIS